jgi:hypothetical protein
VVLGSAPLLSGLLVLAMLFGLQYLVASLRRRSLLQGIREQVQAVVLETTGDLSVLRVGEPFDRELLHGIRGIENLRP